MVQLVAGVRVPQLHADRRRNLGAQRLGPLLGVGFSRDLDFRYLVVDRAAAACTGHVPAHAAGRGMVGRRRDIRARDPDVPRRAVR